MIRRGEEGFALVTALWFLALLALVAVIVEGWISSALDRATTLKERTASAAALNGAADRIGFMLATGGASPRGLELVPVAAKPSGAAATLPANTPYVALDGRPYRFGSVLLRVQDEGGLFDLHNPAREPLERLLGSYGISIPEADRLAAALALYAKKPAEGQATAITDVAYARAGLAPARYSRLLTPWELYRILGWPQAEALWHGPASFPTLVTTGPVQGLDINTAPAKVLTAFAGIDEREAARLVAGRALSPIADLRDLQGAITAREDQPLQLAPSNIVRLTLTEVSDPLAHIVSVRLTPAGPSPYQIDFAVDLPQQAEPNPAPAIPLPDLPAAAAGVRQN
jgi:type II secretory pathway component PulK